MVTPLRGSDPGSISRLGGLLRTTSAALTASAVELHSGTPIATFCLTTATHLDSIGSALQVHAQQLAEAGGGRWRVCGRGNTARG